MNIRIPEQNIVMLTGRLTRDAEVRYSQKGDCVCNFNIAVNKRYKDQTTGEWKDSIPTYVPIVVWGPMGERCKERGKKGTPVHVEGRLKSDEYTDKNSQKRTSLKVVATRVQFLAVASAGEADAPPETVEAGETAETETAAKAPGSGGVDEVPF